MKSETQRPVHIIIGETHYSPMGIELALALLPKLLGKVVLCIENSFGDDAKKIIEYYLSLKQNSDFISNRASFWTYQKLLNHGETTGLYTTKEISEWLFGKHWIAAYNKLCVPIEKGEITVHGIDHPDTDTLQSTLTLGESVLKRSQYMAKELVEISQTGCSTITVVGALHVPQIHSFLVESTNRYFCVIPQDPTQFTNEPRYHTSFKQIFETEFSLQNQQKTKELQIKFIGNRKIDFFENKPLEGMLQHICTTLKLAPLSARKRPR